MHAFPECNVRASVSGTRMGPLEGAGAEGYGGEENASTVYDANISEKCRTRKYIEYDKGIKDILVVPENL